MCQAEEELKNINSNAQDNNKEKHVKKENKTNNLTTSNHNVVPPVNNTSDAPEDNWDDIPFAPIGLQYPNILNCM